MRPNEASSIESSLQAQQGIPSWRPSRSSLSTEQQRLPPCWLSRALPAMSRLLIVNRDAQVVASVMRVINEAQWSLTHCSNAESGQRALEEEHWALVILDATIPGIDVVATLRRYRSRDVDAHVLLFLECDGPISARIQALDEGADDYLCKPFDLDELTARVRARIRRTGAGTSGVLTYDDLQLDPVTGRAMRVGRAIDLTPKERALLRLLMQHADQVLSRSQIYERVWDEAYDGLSTTLEFHVTELRRKLEAYGPRLIHTVRRRGYSFGRSPR